MVCKDCRNVETVDVGVGDYLVGSTVDVGVGDYLTGSTVDIGVGDHLIESTVEIGVGDGIIEPDWLLKDEGTGVPDATNEETKTESNAEDKSLSKAEEKPKSKIKAGEEPKSNIKAETKTKSKSKAETKAKPKSKAEEKRKSRSKEETKTESIKKVVIIKRGKTNEVLKNNINSKKLATLKIKLKPLEREKSTPVNCVSTRSRLKADKVDSDFSPYTESDESSMDVSEFVTTELSENKRQRIYKKVECEVCKRLFRANYMKEHMRSHEEDVEKRRPFKCETCDKRFANIKNFNNHSKGCGKDESEFQCHICQKNLCNKHSLDLHIETHSANRPYNYQCHLCAKLFKNVSNLNYHIKGHSEEKPFACHICQKRFRDKRGMTMHVTRFHQRIFNKFECDMCDKVFRQKCRLNAHRDEHLGIKRFKCDVCEKQFGSYNVWKTHLLIHTDKKRMSCSECGKGFNHGTDLKRHMSTHTGIKPFRCDTCSKQFIHKVYLARHKCAESTAAAGHSETRKKKCSFEAPDRAVNSKNQISEHGNRFYVNSDYVMGERAAINCQIANFENNDNRFENDLFHHL